MRGCHRDNSTALRRRTWGADIQATRARVPEAAGKIVFDRFHVMGHVGKEVDQVRKQEHRELLVLGDEMLKGSMYLWLSSREHVPERRREDFNKGTCSPRVCD